MTKYSYLFTGLKNTLKVIKKGQKVPFKQCIAPFPMTLSVFINLYFI